MIIEHQGERPEIHESAYIAPTATICGDVRIGKNVCVLFNAVVSAEGGRVEIGNDSIVMEHSVLRGTRPYPLSIGNNVLVGPRAYLTGCTVDNYAFLATGSTIFNGASIGEGSEIRINGVVHIRSTLPSDSIVPIGWVAVGNPAEIIPPDEHEQIWEIQEPLDFPMTVFGLEREPPEDLMPKLTERYTTFLKQHKDDVTL